MSAQEKVEDSRLLESISQQLNLYDNLFPKVESKELQVLFALIRIYLARCDNPELKREGIILNPQLMKRLSLTYFDPFTTSTSRNMKEALISRLTSIRKYRTTNPEVVRRALVTCFYEEGYRVRKKQLVYLQAFMKNPGKTFTEVAEQLSVTPQAVSRAYRHMDKLQLCYFYGHMNYPAFKLRHYVVFFTPVREYGQDREFLRKLLFNNTAFALSINADIYEGSGWASFLVPDQKNQTSEFKKSLNELRGEVFRELRIADIRSFSTGSNFEFFDGKRWFFDPQLWTYGFFEFIRENKELLRKTDELRYSIMPIGFDRIDYLIASIMAADSLIPHDNIRERLSEFGYNISRPSVTRRIRRLTSARIPSDDEQAGTQPVLYRYMTYSGLGLSNLNAYLIECDEKYVEEMCYAVGYLPYYFLYRTEKGMLLYIKSTAADIAKFNYMIRGLSEISIAAYSNRFENMGVRSSMRLYDKWDELGQKWVCTHGELDFVKRFEAI